MADNETFRPDWVSPPGDTIGDALDELGMSQAEFAERTGFSRKHVNQLIKGKVAITADAAVKLEAVLGEPAQFWLTREVQYREALAWRDRLAEAAKDKDFLKVVPVRDMIAMGWVRKFTDKGRQVLEVLRFFGVASVDAWEAQYRQRFAPAFRKSPAFGAKWGPVAAWLRMTEIEAGRLDVREFDQTKLRASVNELRLLTLEPDPDVFVPELQRICGEAGVAVVFVPTPKGCPASGATWWRSGKPVLALTLRHKSNDHLWFSFFHEIGHILKHGRKDVFIEGKDIDGLDPDKEAEADEFAAQTLIPDSRALARLKAAPVISSALVEGFAESMGIAPGIVVGRLQHEGALPYNHLNGLKVKYEWVK